MNAKILSVSAIVLVLSALALFAGPPVTAGGSVKSVSGDGSQLVVVIGAGKSAKEQTFRVTTASKLTLDGNPAKLRDLAEGTKITVSYDKTTNEVVSIRATTAKADAPEKDPKDSPDTSSSKSAAASARTKTTSGSGGSVAAPGGSSAAVGEWPQWRGPDRTGISKETGLLKQWPEGGPSLAWQTNGLGQATSSLAITGGRIYTLGKRGNEELVFCLERDGGKQVWATPIGTGQTSFDHKEPKSTPTVDGSHLYVVGMNGTLACLETATGKLVWKKEFESDFGGKMMSRWGWAESPLVDGDRVVVTPGGDQAALVALNKNSGQLIWKAAVPQSGGAGYSSIVTADVGGVRQYITLLGQSSGLVGVAAKDGKLLWKYPKVANSTANIPTAIVSGDLVFCSTGYQKGAALLKLSAAGGGVKAEEKYFLPSNQFQNHHGGMVLIGDHVYAGSGHNNGIPTCVNFKSGKIVWGSERGPGERSAAVTYADGHLYFRYESAVMALIEATPAGLKVKGSFRIPNGATPSWSHPVVAGGRLYLRDQDRLLVYDVRDGASAGSGGAR